MTSSEVLLYYIVAFISVSSVFFNIALLALSFKLYTEFFKERVKNK